MTRLLMVLVGKPLSREMRDVPRLELRPAARSASRNPQEEHLERPAFAQFSAIDVEEQPVIPRAA